MSSTRRALSLLVAGATVLGTGFAAERQEFRDWPAGTSPREVGKRVAENCVVRPFERPTRFVIYRPGADPLECLGLAALTQA